MLKIPEYTEKKELFNFLVENKEVLINQKKSEIKQTDTFSFAQKSNDKVNATKSNDAITDISNLDEINVIAVLSTTNIMDSHDDVHLPNCWKKTLQENKRLLHVQEHKSSEFDKIISSGKDLKAYTKVYKWSELGFDFVGNTEALIFDSIVRKERNEFMFEQYAKGYVINHSVGMRYIKLLLAVNDEDYPMEFDAWNKYYKEIANKELADEKGFFYIVKEAQLIEGSAVTLGSNPVTPTLENNKENKTIEFLNNLNKTIEPAEATQEDFLKELINKF